uniref:Uncharacterized protein n=1 Tax=Megaselia scalaris TaxID=36166 RepID=T1GW36_MEGSC
MKFKSDKPKIEPIVLVHGGAGTIAATSITPKVKGVTLAVRMGYKALEKTGNVLDAVQEAVRSMELDDHFNAGYGSVLNWNGDVEMDAAIMNGADLNCGSVSVLKNILSPISVARMVMEKSRHKYLAGEGAMQFARCKDVEVLPDGTLVTEKSQIALENFKKAMGNSTLRKSMSWSDLTFGEPGTVGAVAIDAEGNIAAATSTLPGRIGDSPIIGGGTIADNQFVGVSATGHGETFIRYTVAQKILALIEFKGFSAQQASEKVLNDMTARFNETGGVISIDANGDVGIHFTSKHMAWAYRKGSEMHYGITPGEDNVEEIK